MKKNVLNLILFIIISIIMYLFLANIFHMFYIQKYEVYDFNNEIMIKIKSSIKELEDTIKEVKDMNESAYTVEEYSFIINTLDSGLDTINNNSLLAYNGVKKIYLNDMLKLYMEKSISNIDQINLLNILATYNESINDYIMVYKANWISNSYAINDGFTNAIDSYKYRTNNFMDYNINNGNQSKITSLVYNYYNMIVTLDYHAKLVIKGGVSY